MVDYSVNSNYDLHFNENGEFETVDGLAEFEENLMIKIDYNFATLIGEYKNLDTASQKIRLMVTRLAKDFDVIDQIKRIVITEPEDKPETLSIDVFYTTGDTFEETI